MGNAEFESKNSGNQGGKVIMGINIAARIRATGKCTGRTDKQKRPVCSVQCQGCGKDILSDDGLLGVVDAGYVEYVKTKRGTELFFHTACREKVWRHGIV